MESVYAMEELVAAPSVRVVDLRSLGQDEIQCLANLCGDVPARLQDMVNVIIDKSIFNESSGSRRQTFDRDRFSRHKDRRLSPGSVTTQLHLAVDSAGRSHRDLILHFCRQLHICEKGDRAMCQSHPRAEGYHGMNLKRMARASFAECRESFASPSSLANGKASGGEILHRPDKKMKTKEEARRRAAEVQAATIPGGKYANMASSGHKEILEDPSVQAARDINPLTVLTSSTAVSFDANARQKRKYRKACGKYYKRLNLVCSTCLGTFVTIYSLRRHLNNTGHVADEEQLKFLPKIKEKNVVTDGDLHCICGVTFATPYTKRRHTATKCSALEKTSMHTIDGQQQEAAHTESIPAFDRGELDSFEEGNIAAKVSSIARKKHDTFLSKSAWKDNVSHFECQRCLKRFFKKRHYLRHLQTHFKQTQKEMAGPPGKVVGRRDGTKARKHIGRPPKREVMGNAKEGRLKKKSKHKLDPTESRAEQSYMEEIIPIELSENNVVVKPLTFTCQECGKAYDEFSRYSGHLSMHARLRKVYVGGTANALKRMDTPEFKEWSAVGFHNLLKETSGTYLSGLPAHLLFSLKT